MRVRLVVFSAHILVLCGLAWLADLVARVVAEALRDIQTTP